MPTKIEAPKKKKRVQIIYEGGHPQRCGDCGFMKRGENHDNGTHHQIGKGGKADIS